MKLIELGYIVISSCLLLKANYIKRDSSTHHYYIIESNDGDLVEDFCWIFGLVNLGQVGILDNYYAIGAPKTNYTESNLPLDLYQEHKNNPRSVHYNLTNGVTSFEPQGFSTISQRNFLKQLRGKLYDRKVNKIRNKLGIRDPGFPYQWHLSNRDQPGNDMNVLPVWKMGYTGKGKTVALIDDGLDHMSTEMSNFRMEGSFDFYSGQEDPEPNTSKEKHGTRCAGEVAAARDDHCGVGVAFDAGISGIRALPTPLIESDQAISMTYNSQLNDIYSCSWGPDDDGVSLGGPPKIVEKAMKAAIERGRGGKGSLYVFASGNGAYSDDNCNFDGYANSIYTIAVGAIDNFNRHPFYSEGCSALMVVTYSSGDDMTKSAIYTSDVNGQCTDRHSGTSAAAPLVSGTLALLLEANPNLTWRDVQHLLVRTAVPIALDDPSWSPTYTGRPFSSIYGYGKVDAARLIRTALFYQNVNPQTHLTYGPYEVNASLPDTDVVNTYRITVPQDDLTQAHLHTLEHVTVTFTLNHTQRRDVEMFLTSPHGITSHLVQSRLNDTSNEGFDNWTVMSVQHWDEPALGDWTLTLRDRYPYNGYAGSIFSYSITFYGPSTTAPSSTNPYPYHLHPTTKLLHHTDGPPHTGIWSLFHRFKALVHQLL